MNLSFNRKDALRLLRHLSGGGAAMSDIRVVARGKELFFETAETTASMEALILEPGAFVVSRETFARLLRSFPDKTSLTLTADAEHFRLDNFKGQVRAYDPAPMLADEFTEAKTGNASQEPDPQSWARL